MAADRKRPRNLPPLVALRAFEAVGSTGSVRAAAEALAVSPTVVSRHLDNLEKRLGVALIAPKGRSVTLTETGRRFHAEVARAFDLIDAATGELVKPVRQPLRLWCWPGLAVMRLLPRLPELEASLPGYAVHFHPTLARPDLNGGEADAEILYRTADEPRRAGIVEIELARPRVMPVASPALAGRLGRPPEDRELLFELPWIHELSSDEWRTWLHFAGLPIDGRAQERLEGVRLWHAHLAIGAAQLGQGVALANELLVEGDLADGRLIEIGRTDVRLGSYVLAMRAETQDDEPMRALADWLLRATKPSDDDCQKGNDRMQTN
ncbi:MAG: LysR family transcriptional regulator [Hyphomicrobiales bacterium]|nr:LysR family transcriptional regulator [Hyphomicrobiales bacterium]